MVFCSCMLLLYRAFGYVPNEHTLFYYGRLNTMEKEKKAKAPSKKELMREIENLDTNKVFDLVSLSRTNIANIIAIRELLKG